jgi:hypothetical protein
MRFKSAILLAGLAVAAAVEAGPHTPPPGIAASSIPGGNWATGFIDYVRGGNVDPAGDFADPVRALGAVSGDMLDVVSLGDAGSITLSFAGLIVDVPNSPDFAVFENGFIDAGSGGIFGELARVEVSVNGTDWFRFPGLSATPAPVSSFGTLDPTNVRDLAGTYPAGVGTPFDLAVFGGAVNNVRYVRIIDIVGNGTALDAIGAPIYDPSPTTLPGGGFDLAGVGAVQLAPIPEPGTYALMAAGLVVVLTIARRRRRA